MIRANMPPRPRRTMGAELAERPLIPDALPVPESAPGLLHRDDDVLAMDKPAGWLTHSDGEGRRPDVVGALDEQVGIHQRLDVGTSGVLLFSRSVAGARRLQRAFEGRRVRKRYLAVVEGTPPSASGVLSKPIGGRPAETRYEVAERGDGWTLLRVEPITGRTHQIRLHLAGVGCPIRGDMRHGEPLDPRSPRLLLHCLEVAVDDELRVEAPPPPCFARHLGQAPEALRAGLRADPGSTCFREINGAADGRPGVTVDRYGDWLRIQRDDGADEGPLPPHRGACVVHGRRDRSRGAQEPPEPRGEPAPAPLEVTEHGVRYHVELADRLSTGLFLDQRPQRAWLRQHADGARVLNTFAHAGAFSVAAAVGGAETVSVDLSRSWLERLPPQLAANGVDPARHDRIHGDVFDWVRRLARRGERFDLVVLDPPGTSVGRRKKRWSATRDYHELVALAAPLVSPGGRLWTATNVRKLLPRRFARLVRRGLPEGARLERVCPPPVDFPHDGPTPVKTFVWRL